MIDDAVGDTPVVILQRVVPAGAGSVRVKLETRSPNATVLDRLARRSGPLTRVGGDGALAIAAAMEGALHGRQVEALLPEDTAIEVRQTLQAYGAKVTLTPFAEGPAGARRLAGAEAPGEARLEAMAEVGRELLATIAADGGRVDAFVAPVGTGATLTAVGRILRAAHPAVRLVAVKPLAGPWRPHRQAGVFPADEAPLLAIEVEPVVVDDAAAWKMRERLGREEGLLVSIGSAAAVEAACRVAAALGPAGVVYTLAADTGERDFSLAEQF